MITAIKRQRSNKREALSKEDAKQAYARWFRGIEAGYKRIISPPDKDRQTDLKRARINWILRRVSTVELDSMSGKEFEDLQYEIACFLTYIEGKPENNPWMVNLPEPLRSLNRPELPDKDVIRKILDWLRRSVGSILNKQPFGYEQPAGRREMSWNPSFYFPGSNGGWWEGVRHHDEDHDWMLRDFFKLLKTHVADILKCPCTDCHGIFVRERSNQRFCSKRCQEKQAKRIQHSIPPERYGKRGRPRAAATPDLPQPTKGGTHGKKTRP